MLICCNSDLLSRNIRLLRKRKKMSRAKFAEHVDMSPNQLLCIEQGLMNQIDHIALNNISVKFKISPDEILSENLEQKYAKKRLPMSRK